jgi:queuine tRNA-ribosyltransferase
VIRSSPKNGSLTDKGITFKPEGSQRKYQLTPEKSVQLQINYGADIVVCLDDCTHVDDDPTQQEVAVRRTLDWAKKCCSEFDRLLEEKGLEGDSAPRLFAVIQGGGDKELRKLCADGLLEIGFDGYGYGGWPLDSDGKLLEDMLGYTREIIHPEYPMHALGVGHPEYVLRCYELGYQMFDSALPTRDARRGRLYCFTGPEGLAGDWFEYLYINDQKHIKSALPISEHCDCYTCHTYSRGYLHHLFKINDHLFYRLTTIHNLRFMSMLEDRMRLISGG